jgi:hypothetical protein
MHQVDGAQVEDLGGYAPAADVLRGDLELDLA